MENKEKQFIVIKDTFLKSILADTYTFGSLLVLWFLNYHYLGNSTLIKWVVAFFVITTTLGRAINKSKKFTTKEEVINYLNN